MELSFIDANTLTKWQEKGRCSTGNNVRVLFTTMGASTGVRPDIVKKHPNSYIPNSSFFDFETRFCDASSAISNTMCSPSVFQTEAQKLGIKNDDTLVIYDDYGNFCASRVWFMFKNLGHKHVYVLDGGLFNWLVLSLPVVNELKATFSHSRYTVKKCEQFQFVDSHFVADCIGKADNHILDARALQRFRGETPETRKNVRSGHIPSSQSLHYARLQKNTGELVGKAQLTELFSSFQKENTLVLTCGSGVTACILAHVAYTLGFEKLRVYDGSWSEWGANPDLPIQIGQS